MLEKVNLSSEIKSKLNGSLSWNWRREIWDFFDRKALIFGKVVEKLREECKRKILKVDYQKITQPKGLGTF